MTYKQGAQHHPQAPTLGFYKQKSFSLEEFVSTGHRTVGLRIDDSKYSANSGQVCLSGAKLVLTVFGWSVYAMFTDFWCPADYFRDDYEFGHIVP